MIWIKFVAQICDCSVDTELIDRNNRAKNQCNGFFTSVVVNGLLSTTFTFQFSSSQRAGGLKYRMPAFSEIDHDLSNSVPFTIWHVDVSSIPHFSQPSPRCDQHPDGKLLAYVATFKEFATQSFSFTGVHHLMSLNMDMKMILR